jgi:hypothetical protein
MEELLTAVILVCFSVALEVNDAFTHQPQVPTYDEVEKSNNITEVRPLTHHLHSRQRGPVTGKRVASLTFSQIPNADLSDFRHADSQSETRPVARWGALTDTN